MNQLYQTFVEVVENDCSFVRAAAALHLTQPTVSRQVQQLEDYLGARLFNRVGKRLVLNHAGELAFRYTRSLLAVEQKMFGELAGFASPDTGTIYIGAGLTPSIYLLPPLFTNYRKLYPKVNFQCRIGSSKEVWASLMQQEVDMGIVTTIDAPHPEFVRVPLFHDDLLLVAAPDHPLANQGVTFVETLAYPYVVMRQGSSLRKIVSELVQAAHLSMDAAMETDSLESLNRLVQCGAGLSVLPRSVVQDDIISGRLVVVPLSDTTFGARTITLVYREDSTLSAAAAQFARVLPDLAAEGVEKTASFHKS